MIIIIATIASYVLMGLMLGFGIATYGKAKDWDDDNIFLGSVASAVLWPIIPLILAGIFIFRRLDELSTTAAQKFR